MIAMSFVNFSKPAEAMAALPGLFLSGSWPLSLLGHSCQYLLSDIKDFKVHHLMSRMCSIYCRSDENKSVSLTRRELAAEIR